MGGHSKILDRVRKEPVMEMISDRITPEYIFQRPFRARIISRTEWKPEEVPDGGRAVQWYTDGSKTESGVGAGIYGDCKPACSKSYSLGRYPTVFQAEVYAILCCVSVNLERGYKGRPIYIFTDSQAAIKALSSCKVGSGLVWECLQLLTELARYNTVNLCWVPGHTNIEGNERADELAKQGSSSALIGPEPACGVSCITVKGALEQRLTGMHQMYWESLPGHRQAKVLIGGTSKKTTTKLLNLNRKELRTVVGLKTGHCGLRKHLYNMRITASPTCRWCGWDDESAVHVLGQCDGLARKRQEIFGAPSLETEDLREISVTDLLKFNKRAGLLEL
jgi:ribonuclease HI